MFPFRLPRADTWADVPVQLSELKAALLLAPCLLLLRVLFEASAGVALGRWLGFFEPCSGWQMARRHVLGGFVRNSRSKKVLETFWRFSAYCSLVLLGLLVLHDKPWLLDVQQGFVGYPRHPVPADVWWYYMLECGFYLSLLLACPFDVRRSDSWQMFCHHLVTIGLIGFSWTINFVRVGTLVLLSHDVSDVFLELCKLLRYSRRGQWLCNALFLVFLAR